MSMWDRMPLWLRIVTAIALTLYFVAGLTWPVFARDLPKCDSDAILKTFVERGDVYDVFEMREVKSDDARRWCYVYFVGRYGRRSPFMEALFTIEWIDADSGIYFLETKQKQQSCRGVMGNHQSRERCND